ncbi:MAG: EAL domain-containing protein [Rhizobiaceae bacterium]|nr:EAL domain-containing protein [Rhizobiaceae bacterium]
MSRETKVLVLDDDPDDIFLIEDAINDIPDSEYIVESTVSPNEAADLLSKNDIDVVFCDYYMGQVTGIEFIAEQRERGIDIPMILLTGMTDRSADEAALKAGASDFISKVDVDPDTLDRAIRYAVANVRRQRVFRSVLENVNAGVALIDEDLNPTIWNPEFEAISQNAGIEHDEDAIVSFARRVLTESKMLHVNKRVYEKKVSYTSDKAMVLLLHDVTEHIEALRERQEAENKAAHLAMNCSLTNLPNRNSFAEKMKEEVERAQRDNYTFFLMNLDLNKFKEVNDVYGHQTGDKLLSAVAQRLNSICGPDVFLARLGGDEFVAIQPRLPDDAVDTPKVAQEIVDCMDQPFDIDGIHLQIGVSIGVSKFPDHGRTTEELMSNADTAMYRAKRESSERVHAFNEEMDRKIREARMLSHELTKAVEAGEIDVHFQAQANVDDGAITGFEALARWKHPELGYVSPVQFIPLAEERGLIRQLGNLVLHKACDLAVNWPEDKRVAVNVSPVQIRDTNLIESVHHALLKSGLPAKRLELEVTESVLIEDQSRALFILRSLKNLGVSIALDDFGTGFSSLSTLIAFPFDKIKIDRSFVENCNKNSQAALVTRTIINMGIQMGCHIVAEGVQNSDHIDFLRAEGCQSMQGYLIGKPVPADNVYHYFDDNLEICAEPKMAVGSR